MNIKKIIKEEMDDLDWMRDISLLSFEYVNNKALEFDPPITDGDYWEKVKSSLEGIGCKIRLNMYSEDFETGILGLFIRKGVHVAFTLDDVREDSYQEHIDRYAERDVEILDGRTLIPQ